MTRLELIDAGVIREGTLLSPLPCFGAGLRLDVAGHAAAARHLRDGDHGRRLMPPPARSDADLDALAALQKAKGPRRGV